ncbi:MAG: hypothetical protein ACRENS_12085 [Candidatus Eiseniibacteriota bacterium]
MRPHVANKGDVLRGFYRAVVARDFQAARKLLRDDLEFVGSFETYPNADAYLTTLVAEWHVVKDGKIRQARSAFDGRPFAAMFSGAKKG